MSVTYQNATVTEEGNDATTFINIPFKFLENGHIFVFLVDNTAPDLDQSTVVPLTEDQYTLLGAGEAEGTGTIELDAPIPGGRTCVVQRRTPITQLETFTTQGAFPVARHEAAFDKLTLICQELRAKVEILEGVAARAASASSINLGDNVITKDFTTNAVAVENTFPLEVACTGGYYASDAWVTRLQNLDDSAEVFDEKPAIDWWPGPASNLITLRGVDGLKPNTNYRIRMIVLRP